MEPPYPIIVALDKPNAARVRDVVRALCGYVAGFKLGLPLLLAIGVEGARGIRSLCTNAIWIADLKAADVSHVLTETYRVIADVADYIIAHAFVGFRGALEALPSSKLILVASMSHEGSIEVIDKCLHPIVKVVEKVKPWGIVAPATRPEVIVFMRRLFGNAVKILSPGIGAQGAKPGTGICAGADYEIIGRALVEQDETLKALKTIVDEMGKVVKECKSYVK